MLFLNKKIIRSKMKRIQAKKQKTGTYEIDKIHYPVLIIKGMY